MRKIYEELAEELFMMRTRFLHGCASLPVGLADPKRGRVRGSSGFLFLSAFLLFLERKCGLKSGSPEDFEAK